MKQLSELTWGEIESDIKEFYDLWKIKDCNYSTMSAESAIPMMFAEKYGWFENIEHVEFSLDSIDDSEPIPAPNVSKLNDNLNLIATIFHHWFKTV